MTTRPEVRAEVVREFGGYAGTLVETGSGSDTLTLPGAWRATGGEWEGNQVFFPDQLSEDNRVRAVESITRGRVTLDSERVAISAGERYELHPDDTSAEEIDVAISRCLRQTLRPAIIVLPTLPDKTLYTLPEWIEYRSNIDGVELRASPCVIANEDLSSWSAGANSVPTGWTSAGCGVRRDDSGSGVVLNTSGATGTFEQSVPVSPRRTARDLTVFFDVEVGSGQVVASVGGQRTTRTLSTGVNSVTVSDTVPEGESTVVVALSISPNETVTLRRVLAFWGDRIPDQLLELGSVSYPSTEVTWQRSEIVSAALSIQLSAPLDAGQLIVHTRAPFADLDNDVSESEAPLNLLFHGAIFLLSDREVAGRDASVWDRRVEKHGPAYAMLAERLLQMPVPKQIQPQVVDGA